MQQFFEKYIFISSPLFGSFFSFYLYIDVPQQRRNITVISVWSSPFFDLYFLKIFIHFKAGFVSKRKRLTVFKWNFFFFENALWNEPHISSSKGWRCKRRGRGWFGHKVDVVLRGGGGEGGAKAGDQATGMIGWRHAYIFHSCDFNISRVHVCL